MLLIDRLRNYQEQQLLRSLESWNLAKQHLEEAITTAEAKEREFQKLSEVVKLRLEARDLVERMVNELEAEPAGERSLPTAAAQAVLPPPPEPTGKIEASKEAGPSSQPEVATPDSRPAPGVPVRGTWRPLFSSAQRSRAARLSIL